MSGGESETGTSAGKPQTDAQCEEWAVLRAFCPCICIVSSGINNDGGGEHCLGILDDAEGHILMDHTQPELSLSHMSYGSTARTTTV